MNTVMNEETYERNMVMVNISANISSHRCLIIVPDVLDYRERCKEKLKTIIGTRLCDSGAFNYTTKTLHARYTLDRYTILARFLPGSPRN